MLKQTTLAGSFSFQGKGVHTGLNISISFHPAPDNYGYKVIRTDLSGEPVIDAVAENVVDTLRGTIIAKHDCQVSTIEHALAALYAAGIDNCRIETDAPEFPILDGSSKPYSEAIRRVGIAEGQAPKDYYIVKHKMEVKDKATGASLTLLPDDSFCADVLISFDSPVLSNQHASLHDLSLFHEIEAARTFVFVREIEALLNSGRIKGGDLDNAIVIYDREMPQDDLRQLAAKLDIPIDGISSTGYINHKPLTYDNEPARHKLIDLIGDMALIGKPLKGRIIASRPGHKINNQLARMIRKDIKQNDMQAPTYNPNSSPIMDVNRIKELLPHRYPFLLVDKIIELEENYIVGLKNISVNEPFFQGHFPQEPIMPGVLQVEAMAQTGGLLVLNSVDEPERYSTYFMKVDQVKFRQKVVPGDTLILRLELTSPIRRNIATMKGRVFVGDKLVSEAEFMAQIIKNK
ncbi:MAG: bifunctional UDP-3-O-[3-hydroxymyristoyl] N-acetylglucosamine deacetylase/3-hydroxyacyl-ACP dehydratase [Tannerellaceae bacterium]|jgi:UDP-3-O-[3-hydroxymyristoyl] N-acetylglucosamine deacetylase/3-hydroxyacyl-[acyl-carrier-protein] dehydratase|nr:bifunctional UDP-3-O-[3-hydroxymyristoyl] N-acetylglucosamine deacetylase/3-hydroxyacyl-ACP dehydratase [Tannerellaceae bacterium]